MAERAPAAQRRSVRIAGAAPDAALPLAAFAYPSAADSSEFVWMVVAAEPLAALERSYHCVRAAAMHLAADQAAARTRLPFALPLGRPLPSSTRSCLSFKPMSGSCIACLLPARYCSSSLLLPLLLTCLPLLDHGCVARSSPLIRDLSQSHPLLLLAPLSLKEHTSCATTAHELAICALWLQPLSAEHHGMLQSQAQRPCAAPPLAAAMSRVGAASALHAASR